MDRIKEVGKVGTCSECRRENDYSQSGWRGFCKECFDKNVNESE